MEFQGLVDGALSELMSPWNYQPWGTLSPEQTAEYMAAMLVDFENGSCSSSGVPTPFWDEGQDVDDEESEESQTWYGEVSDPEAPPSEISFIENIGIWALTGFIAYSGQIGAAIFFHTIAPSFVLAWHRGDVGEIWRVIVDAAEYGRIDTSSAAPNDVVQMPIIAGDGEHDITLIKVE